MYFNTKLEVNQVKAEYHRLALLHHPDRGGDTATMQIVNAEYQQALAQCDGQITGKYKDGNDRTYTYDQKIEQEIIDKIAEILSHKLEGIEVELNGTWVWVGGETYQHRAILGKVLKMNFIGKHKKWAWHNGPKYRRRNKLSYDEIRAAYGSKKYEAQEEAKALV